MSRAFTKEGDDQWLSDVTPTLHALITFLTRENNGIRILEERTAFDKRGREVHFMSNGLAYLKDEGGRWAVAPEEET